MRLSTDVSSKQSPVACDDCAYFDRLLVFLDRGGGGGNQGTVKEAKRMAMAHNESVDFEEEESEDDHEEQMDAYEPRGHEKQAGGGASIKRQRTGGRSYYRVAHGSGPSQALSMARRPVSKAQAMDWAKRATEGGGQPLRLPTSGAFIIPRYMSQLGAVGVSGAILDARDGGVVSLEPGCSLYGAGGSVKVGFGGKGGITMEVIGPPMQVSSKARAAAAEAAGAAAALGPGAAVLPTSYHGGSATAVAAKAEPPAQMAATQGGGSAGSAGSIGAQGGGQIVSISPSSEPGDEPSESKNGSAVATAAGTRNAAASGGQPAAAAAAAAPVMMMT